MTTIQTRAIQALATERHIEATHLRIINRTRTEATIRLLTLMLGDEDTDRIQPLPDTGEAVIDDLFFTVIDDDIQTTLALTLPCPNCHGTAQNPVTSLANLGRLIESKVYHRLCPNH